MRSAAALMRNTLLAAVLLAAVGCYERDHVPVCTADEQCSAGQQCLDGACVAAGCPETPCPAGQACVAGTCLTELCGSVICAAGEQCIGDRCISPACVGITCKGYEACVAGRCLSQDCSDRLCAETEVCSRGACVDRACVNVVCGAGQVCAAGRCVQRSCVETCPDGAEVCVGKCRADEVCDDGACVLKSCVGIACGAGSVCAQGSCFPVSCGVSSPCLPGQVCDEGKCVDLHCAGSFCRGDTLCIDGACVSCAQRESGRACGGGLDEDCDAKVDCADPDCGGETCGAPGSGFACEPTSGTCRCSGGATATSPGKPESPEASCGDGLDNDCDALVDCNDSDCTAAPVCAVCEPTGVAEQLCGDGRDDDCNGTRDCADTACNGIPCASGGKVCANEACACPTGNAESSCTNNADDNCDGLVDCDDDGCTGQVCGANGRTCAGRLCLCAGGDVETSCGDGLDNDCDGLFDCDDADCERLECNDGNACTDQETCNAGVCGDGAPRSCTAGTCEVSVCNPTTGECDRSPALAGTACNDENACTVQDQCDEVGLCTGGAPRGCDDSNPCTVNDCQPASGCDFSRPVDGTPACGPGDEGVCRTGVCIAAREISCTDGVDNDQDGLIDCMDLADCGNVACEDGRGFCTSGEVCQPDGSCGGGTEVLCALPPPGGCFLLAGTCQPEDGSCVYAFAPATHVCRAANGACDSEELCTGASGECPADTKFGAARVCRSAAAGGCDVAETCDGASDECPADAFQPASHVCRSSAGACDPAEQCNGADAQCPGDQLSDASVICRAAAPGGCDVAEHCGGGSVDCPADNFAPANTLCRAAAEGSCDVAERCTGSSASCPSDAVLAVGDPCRASKGICDLAESCNGVDKSCPADAKQPAETPCPDDGNPCTVDECTGSADGCEHSNLPDGTSCDTDSRCLSGACMPYFYGWSTAAFGACTSTCGTGTQSRGVTCQRSDGATVDDSRCDGSSRPAASQGCADYSTCTFSWMTGSYGACVPACGTSTQSRSVWCERSDGTPVAEENCTAAKPAVSTACTDFGACTFSWQASNFGVCSTGCGIGSQSRTITCVRSDGLASADEQCTEPKPATSGSCTDFTGCTFAWKTGSFGSCVAACGSSTQSRSVWCERSDGATVEGTLCGGGEPAATASCTDYSTCTYSWQTSAYGSCAAACGSSTQSRSVWCQRSDGATVEGTFCGGGQPASSASCDDYSTCSYTWMTDPFGACSTSCGSGTQSRTVYCRRSDGTTVGDASCNAGAKPATSQACSDVSSCTFSWQSGAYGSCSTTCGSGTQSRTVSCQRSDGATVSDASCDAGAKPAVSQACTDVSSCTYQWMTNDYGACSTSCGSGNQTRTVYCRRSDGVTVADASCDAGAKPATSQSCTDISSCTYSWVTGDYGACSTTCGSGNQTRTVSCRRSDGATVADASCDAGAKPAASRDCSDVSTCTYGWQSGAYGACSTTCGSGTKSRTVTCVRSDGASVGDASCDAGSKPATSDTCSDTSTCTYSWQAGAYGACSTTCGSGTKNRSVTCVRSDGVSVGDASCDAGSKPATSDSCSDTSTCTYAWETGAWGGCSTTCGTGSQTRSLVCRRSDGAIVAGGNCTSSAPATSQSCSEYGGCTYSWVTGDWGNCLSPDGCAGTQSRSVYCQRSDGGDGGSMCSNLGLQQPESTQACTAQDGNFCSGGTCCLGACIDMNWDTQNCGACGNVCPSWALCCELGVCSAGPCR